MAQKKSEKPKKVKVSRKEQETLNKVQHRGNGKKPR